MRPHLTASLLNTPRYSKTYSNRPTTAIDRFWKHVVVAADDQCWEWQAARLKNGYGVINVFGIAYGAHRVSWVIANGDMPEDLIVCHRCDNPSCVNPGHLFLGTDYTNHVDKVTKGRAKTRAKRITTDQIVDAWARFENHVPALSKREFGVRYHAEYGVTARTLEAILNKSGYYGTAYDAIERAVDARSGRAA